MVLLVPPPDHPLRHAGQYRAVPGLVRNSKLRYSPTAAQFTVSQHEDSEEMLKASAIGNLGNDPELKYSANGAPYLRFNVASNGRVRDESGQWKDETTWLRVTIFGQRAESLSQHLRKGLRVFVDGRLEARPWTGQNGQISPGLELIATDCEFMSARNEDAPQQQARPAHRGTADSDDAPF
mgnify:CR=1 FL=1